MPIDKEKLLEWSKRKKGFTNALMAERGVYEELIREVESGAFDIMETLACQKCGDPFCVGRCDKEDNRGDCINWNAPEEFTCYCKLNECISKR